MLFQCFCGIKQLFHFTHSDDEPENISPFKPILKKKKQTVIKKQMDIHNFAKTACLVLITIFLNSAILTIDS